MRVSINGGEPQDAEEVVLYDRDIPIAACIIQGGAIFFCDAVRDRGDLINVLKTLNIPFDESRMHESKGDIKRLIT